MDFIIRPIEKEDIQALIKLAAKTGPGMTSLPADEKLLEKKIRASLNSFKVDPIKPGDEAYRFVLIDRETDQLVGICAISAKIGGYEPFYSYEIKIARHQAKKLKIDKEVSYLELNTEHDGPSIISSLFIDPDYQGKGLGKPLSLARILFIADFRERFMDTVIAEMRGVIDEQGKSPFWEGTVRHFFDLDFDQADYLSAKDKGFIADLMPHYPIYIPLLPEIVQDSIGKVNEKTRPAIKFLEEEGFKPDGHVDIFDAGPRIACQVADMQSINNSQVMKLEIADSLLESKEALLSNCILDYRVIKAEVGIDGDKVLVSMQDAEKLLLKTGDQVRVLL